MTQSDPSTRSGEVSAGALAPERMLLRGLIPLVAQRAEQEALIRSTVESRIAGAEQKARLSETRVREAADKRRQDAERAHELETQSLRATLDAEVEEARERQRRELAKLAIELSELERKAEEQAAEARWLADAVGESTFRKSQAAHDLATKAIRARLEAVKRSEAEATNMLAAIGVRLPEASGTVAPLEASANEADVIQRALRRLDHAVRPFWMRIEGLLLLGVLTALASAGVASALAFPPTGSGLAIGACASVTAAVVFLALYRVWSRRAIAPAAAAMSESLAQAIALLGEAQEAVDREKDAALSAVRAARSKEIEQAKGRLAEARERYERRRTKEEPRLKAGLQADVDRVTQGREERLAEHTRRFEQASAERASTLEQELGAIVERRDREIADARREAEKGLEELRARWLGEGHRLIDAARDLAQASERAAPGWELLQDNPWAFAGRDGATEESNAADLVRFGWLSVDVARLPGGLSQSADLALQRETRLRLPLSLDLQGRGSLLLHTTPETRRAGIDALRATMLRLLTCLPPGKVRFTMIDPVGLGESFAGFMALADDEPLLVGDRIWTETKHIEQKLTDLTEHMEQVIQKYLRQQFASIQAYNREAGEIAEPFRFLVIADFPANFSEAAAKRLASIVASGPRCGVFTLIATDARTRAPGWLSMADLERHASTFTIKPSSVVAKDDEFARGEVTLESPPPDERFVALVRRIGAGAKDSGRVQVPFSSIAPAPADVWSRSTARDIAIPIGRSGATKVQSLVLGRGTAQHALIAGRTGSGKSTLLHAIITSLALWYSPDEAEVYLLDFKKGVEFKSYATGRLPHARVIGVESEREFGLSVLRRLDAELSRRGSMFRDLGVQDLAGYRATEAARTAAPVPRTLLIVDEFQEFFVEDDKIAQEAMLLLDRLVRQGRAFGMHVVLGSQTIGGAYSLARSTIGQIGVRVALQCSESDSYLILSEDNPAARLLSRPGEAIYNDASGLLEGNSPFQVVWLPDEERESRLSEMRGQLASLRQPPAPALVFEGNVPSKLDESEPLRALRESDAPAGPARVWLGDAVSIKEPTSLLLRPQSGSNLLIVGQNERLAFGLMLASGLAILGRFRRAPAKGPPRISVLEGPSAEWDGVTPLAAFSASFRPLVSHHVARAVEDAVGVLHAELEARRSVESAEHEPLFVFVHGLHRHRGLRRSEDDFSFSADSSGPPRADRQFAELLREGPGVGIHFVVWCDNVTNLERAIDRRGVREFDHRVLFQMSGADSSTLIDTPHAQNLGASRALLYSEETATFEKFRPYAPPAPEALRALLDAWRARLDSSTPG